MANVIDFQTYVKSRESKPAPEEEQVDLPIEMAMAYALGAIYRSDGRDVEVGDLLLDECYAARGRCETSVKVDRDTLLYLHEKRSARLNLEYFRVCQKLDIDPN